MTKIYIVFSKKENSFIGMITKVRATDGWKNVGVMPPRMGQFQLNNCEFNLNESNEVLSFKVS